MASSTGNSLQPFVPGTNPSEAWGKWKKRFQMFYIATEIDKKSIPRQRAILLYNIGELALDIYSTFKIQETDASPTVPDILELFDGHFKPYKNTTYKRYQFFTTEQGENQNFDDYVTELKNKSMDCEFGELADSLVRDRIIIGIKDKALKERMLQDPDLSLAKAIDLGRATETSRQQVKNITREDVDLHSIKYKKQYKKNFKYPVGRKPNVSEEHPNAKVCQNCGSRHPYGKCFAYGKICNSCKKPNHFAKMCRNRVHMLEERAEEEEEMCLQYLSLDSITGLEWTKIILVENNSVNFKLDTGAQVNILPLDTIKNWQNKPCIYPTGIAVYSYTGEKVPIRGKCKASCTSGKKSEILEFLVVDLPAPPILGLAACKKLELILKVESLEQDHTRTKMDASPTKIIESYRDVFDEIGTLPGEHSVILRENAQPRIQLARRIPFALKKPVEMELKSMEEQKIISKVDQPAEWAHPMVIIKKPNGKVRICMDPRELNPWIKMEYRQLPAPEGIIADITKSPIYTVLDAKSAFWQIKLDEKSSSLLTMATPYGYYRFHRLPFGICSAPEVFYKKMQSMFTGIEGVKVYMDDIIIYGNSLTEHNSRLITVLEIARKNNLKFEFNKMQLAQEKVKFIGHEISKNGISADPSKLEAIQKIKRPMDKTSLQRFLGTVNYLAKFMHNLADKTVLLRQLLKKNTLWTWNEAIEKEFIELKNLVSNPPVLGLFDPHRKVTLSVDASQHGLGAVLMQEGRPIAFASASLNNTQKKYAQIEKELLALWYGCQRFNYHLYGRKFTAQTDHKPLLAILKKPLEELSPRLERLVLKLMRYDFNLEYVPGKVIHTADTLSRDSISEETIDTSDLDLQNTIMTLNLKVTTKRYQEILRDMESDEEMIKLRDHILNGWPIHKKSVDYAVKPYWHCKEELYIWKDLICRGQRLVIPKVQRESILQTLHMSHQGISACKNRAHEAIYWPGLDREIEEMVYKCRICQESQPSQRKEPLIPHEIADYPWQKVAIDFFYLDQSVFIIIVDYYSSFPEVIKVASTSAKEILPVLKSTFARHGIPEIIITDNGPPFTSQDFTNFTNEWDIEHKTSSPGYPKSNGLVERMVQTVKKQLKKCRQDNTDPYMCLIALRTTPSNNLPSPAQMLMGRNLRTLIPMKTTKLKPAFISTENILQQKRENQYKMKEYYDRNAKILPKMSSGEQVNAKTSNAWRPATIIGEANQPRSYIIQNNEGRMLKRNRVHLRPRSYPVGQRRSSQSSPQLDPAPSTSSESSGQREPGEFPRLNLSPEELAPSTSTPIGNYNEGGTAYTTRSGRVEWAVEQIVLNASIAEVAIYRVAVPNSRDILAEKYPRWWLQNLLEVSLDEIGPWTLPCLGCESFAPIIYNMLTIQFALFFQKALPIQNVSAFVIKTGSTTQWQATDLAPKEMTASDMRNRHHVQPLLTWSTDTAHPLDWYIVIISHHWPSKIAVCLGKKCKSCGNQNFTGLRFHCLRCQDFDLCNNCQDHLVENHTADHPMQAVMLIKQDSPLFYKNEEFCPQSFTCSFCGKRGFSPAKIVAHFVECIGRTPLPDRPVLDSVCCSLCVAESRCYHPARFDHSGFWNHIIERHELYISVMVWCFSEKNDQEDRNFPAQKIHLQILWQEWPEEEVCWFCRACTKTVSGDVPITNALCQERHQEAEGDAGTVILYYYSLWIISSNTPPLLFEAVPNMETFAADSNMSTDLRIHGEEPLLRSINWNNPNLVSPINLDLPLPSTLVRPQHSIERWIYRVYDSLPNTNILKCFPRIDYDLGLLNFYPWLRVPILHNFTLKD
ncbi:K02A2.6-like [Cordylochernes scorpioides]|uniref:RNA-directed DNA polymerase n=1 Tax=Cordylochernes scorpioides TaxID=51811 RepID=A0ABY6K3J4_9ARAC|nr:K02A2.6-like [Cordylochernes scorpioides]